MKNWKLPALAALAAVAALLTGCTRNKVDAKANEGEAARLEEAPDLSVASVERPELFQLAAVELKKAPGELSATGVVAPDVSRTVPVNALTGGRVVTVLARLGDDVVKGQLLLTMTSPDMSAAISDYRKFRADEKLANTQLERSQLLYSHGAVAQKDLQVVEETYEKAKVDTQTAAQKIAILGGDVDHPSPLIEVRAPVSGTIVEQNVTSAAGVKSLDNSPNLFTIADLSHVWILCDVYENNLAQVHMGDRAVVQLNAYPDRKIEGRVSNISSLLDPATRAAKVRIDLVNGTSKAGRRLRPNMFASVQFVSQAERSRMALPVAAILRLQDRDWVFLRLSDKKFRRAEVQAGPADAGGMQEILAGLRPGDRVAADALQFSRALENAQEQARK